MNITLATARIQDGCPVVDLEIDGHNAYVLEPKLTLLEQNIVVLLDDVGHWEAFTAAFKDEDETIIQIVAGTQDPQLIAIVRRFVAGEVGNLLA